MYSGSCRRISQRGYLPPGLLTTSTSLSTDPTAVSSSLQPPDLLAFDLLTEDDDDDDDGRNNRHSVSTECNSQIYLSVVWFGGKLGAAYYDLETSQIYTMMDTFEKAPDFSILKQVIYQIDADFLITSAKQDERLLQMLQDIDKRSSLSNVARGGQDYMQKKVVLLPSAEFGLQSSKHRIMALQMESMPKLVTEADRAIYISSIVNFDYQAMVRALGGLLHYLDKHRVGVELEDKGIQVPVLAINTFTLKNTVMIDFNTLSALQIFQKEWHPSVYKLGSGMKEGLSLYGVLNRCKSALGSKALRLLMLRPTYDLAILNERYQAITFCMQLRNLEVVATIQTCLKNVKNLPCILSRMANAEASVKDWQALYKTIYNAMLIGGICKAQDQNIDIFFKISNLFTDELSHVATLINKIVDFEESAIQNHFVVKWGVDEILDEKKRTYNGLPDFMSKVAHHELEKLHESIQECNIVYLPQLGYLLAIPITPLMEETKDYTMPGLEFRFVSNKVVYYRSDSTKELDGLLGDSQYEISDHETQIMIRLQNAVLQHTQFLLKVVNALAELDCVISFALVAKDNNYVKPFVSTSSEILIKGGRHPLQELCVSSFVPNDTKSGGNYSRVKLLTGPNASGKSIYLKQVALIVYMAHIGSFVPAEAAQIGTVHHILSRIHTLESVSMGLSTFMIDLNQMSLAIQNATDRSLVVVDEFGKGTDTIDGVSLLASCLKYWIARNEKSPHILVSTHFHSVVSLLPENKQVTLLTLDILRDGEDIVYLYQLTEGHLDSSFACQVAAQAGLPENIILRAQEVTVAVCNNLAIKSTIKNFDIHMKKCSNIVEMFLEKNPVGDDVVQFLKNSVLPLSEHQETSSSVEHSKTQAGI